MKIELNRGYAPKTPVLDQTLTERFKDPEHLISTLNAMKRRNPKIAVAVSEVTLRIRQGYGYSFWNGYVVSYTTRVKMY